MWTAKTSMPTPQYNAAAAAVDGKIYIIGGDNSPKMVQQYDIVTDTWTIKKPTLIEHNGSVAAAVEGKIYVITPSNDRQTVEEYDPVTDTWTAKSPTPSDRWNTTVAVVDRKIFIIGGFKLKTNCGGFACIEVISSDQVEQYDPATDRWTVKTSLPMARGTCVAAAVEGKIYVVGSLKDVQSYDPVTDTWGMKSPLPMARSDMAAAVVDGKIYVIGGTTRTGPTALTITEQYDPVTDTWTTKSPMPTARYDMGVAVVDGKVYVLGGTQSEVNSLPHEAIGSVERYDPAQDAFSRRVWAGKAPMPTARYGMAAAFTDTIYVIGGAGSSILQTVEQYDPATDTWATKNPMPTARYDMAAAVVDGKIYVIGGTTNVSPTALQTVEQYDPATDTWAMKSPMPTRRHNFAVAVVDGKIYAIGVIVGIDWTNRVEEYNPVTDTWTSKAELPDFRNGLAAAAVNGRVYTIGGIGHSTGYSDLDDEVREYNPALNSWTAKSFMPTGRYNFVAAAVNGRIYAIGGYENNTVLNRVEEYDPAQDQ